MQLAASLRPVPGAPSGITDPEVWAHVKKILHFALLPVAGTNWPAKHHSSLGGSWPSYGAMHIPKTRHASRHTEAACSLGTQHLLFTRWSKAPLWEPEPQTWFREFGWEQSEADPTTPILGTLLELAMPIAPFCPLSLAHITLFCGIRANFCARRKRQRRQSGLEVFIRNLQMEKHGGKAFVEGNYYSHIMKKNSGKEIS